MRSFDKVGADRSMVDMLDRVNMNAAAREAAKAEARRAESIMNGTEYALAAAGKFLGLVKQGVLDIAQQLRAVVRRA